MKTRSFTADPLGLVLLLEELLETCAAPDLRLPPEEPLLRRLSCRSFVVSRARR